jgi:hypothetical protein
MTNAEIFMIVFTAVIAITGVLGAIIFNNQLSVMKGQLDEMQAEQRSWVFATNVSISRPIIRDDKGTNISLLFELRNGGRSPALQVSARFRVYLGSVNYRDAEKIVCKDAQPEEYGITLFPDQSAPQKTGWLIPTQEIIAAQKSAAYIIPFVVACISYQFPRSKEYHTTPYEFLISQAVGLTKWPSVSFPIDEKEIAPSDLRLVLLPVASPN